MSRSCFTADERVLETLAQTSALSIEHFEAVCKLAVRLFCSDKQSKRRFTRTASALGWENEQIEKAVLAIAKILMDGVKGKLSTHAFRLVVKGMSLPEEQVEILAQFYETHGDDIRERVSKEIDLNVPHYHNFEWRIDLELGTRFHRNKPKPIVTLRLDTTTSHVINDAAVQRNCLRVDYDGLKRMQFQLETALKEVDSIHCSRVQRYMQ